MITATSSGLTNGKRKLALLIGISEYENVETLRNVPKDANAMATVLKDIGFTVTMELNLTYRKMRTACKEFLKSINSGNLALFYFAGHGRQYQVSHSTQTVR